jgi:hypothetical protein
VGHSVSLGSGRRCDLMLKPFYFKKIFKAIKIALKIVFKLKRFSHKISSGPVFIMHTISHRELEPLR